MISTATKITLLFLIGTAGLLALHLNYALGGHDQMAQLLLVLDILVTGIVASIPRKMKYQPLQPVYIGAREEVTETDIEINT